MVAHQPIDKAGATMVATVPNVIDKTVKKAKALCEAEGLYVAQCTKVDQPEPWADLTDVTDQDDRIVEECHKTTEVGDQLELAGTVGVVLKGGPDPEKDLSGSVARAAPPSEGGVQININILIGPDGTVDVQGP